MCRIIIVTIASKLLLYRQILFRASAEIHQGGANSFIFYFQEHNFHKVTYFKNSYTPKESIAQQGRH